MDMVPPLSDPGWRGRAEMKGKIGLWLETAAIKLLCSVELQLKVYLQRLVYLFLALVG